MEAFDYGPELRFRQREWERLHQPAAGTFSITFEMVKNFNGDTLWLFRQLRKDAMRSFKRLGLEYGDRSKGEHWRFWIRKNKTKHLYEMMITVNFPEKSRDVAAKMEWRWQARLADIMAGADRD
jgi:hypothetical protein